MLKLVRENELASIFADALARDKEINVAVAFWGNGAVEALGFKFSKNARMVCNIDHIGCNPDAIEDLIKIEFKVKTHPRLHGKVYATENICIVGSSNASTNGLGIEDREARGWKEANVLSDDAQLVRDARAFVDEMWNSSEARSVKESDIKEARERRKAQIAAVTPPPRSKTLLAACRENPQAFRNVFVFAYQEDLGPEAKKDVAQFKKQAVAPEPNSNSPNFKRSWAYQADIPEGVWLVDLDCRSETRGPKVWGASKSSGLILKPAGEEEVTITLRGVVSLNERRYPISAQEKNLLEAAAEQILMAGDDDLVPLEQAIKTADKVARRGKKPKS